MAQTPYDIAIIGGGIVGLATALALTEQAPALRLGIVEKEAGVATHQSSHNSGVIHAGIYYPPGSYKARLCLEGASLLTAFCERRGIPYQRCGKVIVATAEEELPRLDRLYERGVANGVPGLERVGPERLREIEPSVPALRGIYSRGTGIVDYRLVAATMAKVLEGRGAAVLTGARVAKIVRADGRLVLETPRGAISARGLINCAGLYADHIARLAGVRTGLQIIPFRGEYYHLRPERRHLVRSLIYPVPDPAFPFLGVHFTRTIQGTVEAGPNAVLAFAREGYSYRQIRIRELAEFLAYPGFWRMAARYWRMGLYEMYRSLHKAAFLRALQRLLPAITAADLLPGGAGVRAQAVERDGSLVDDFRIVETPHGIHVLNAPSPAATASLAIGRHIAGLAARTVTSRTS